ncbi:MAG: SDR family NAD(P)-dependent oxidoreductase [Lentisphaeria bacterium]|jgi:NAD(P)-dependent dehydrogenase (short-subunit alcohol dehydrogenase family)
MDKRFRGKIAVVTGAGGRNIGRALAVGFAREGARTVLVGRTESSLADVAAEIEALDGECMVAPADVSAEADVLRVFSEIAEQFGAVDILLNNAAQNLKCDTVDTDVQDWDRVIAVNLRGPFLCSREALKIMIPRGHGRIINIASMAGKEALATRGAYSASKFALLGLTEAMAAEVNHLDIAINAISPGAVSNDPPPPGPRSKPGDLHPDLINLDLQPRINPDDIVRTAFFLAADDTRAIRGKSIDVYYGQDLREA